MPFPTSFPADSIRHVVGYLRKEPGHDLRCVAEAAYDLLGYAGHVAMPGGDPPAMGCPCPESDEDRALAVEQAFAMRGEADAKIPWDVVVPILWDVIRRIFKW